MASLLSARVCGSGGPSCSHSHYYPHFKFGFGIASCSSSLLSNSDSRRRKRVFCGLSKSKNKTANLYASRQQSIKLPTYDYEDEEDKDKYSLSKFLSHPSGVQAILNTRSLHSFETLRPNIYRCTLPKIQLLNFEATPVMDLLVATTDKECKVEMLCCEFRGSEFVERQNNFFSASMTNHMTWGANGSGHVLEVDVKLSLTLEVFTQPFSSLPISAVEIPGNVVMQALVDRLVPLLLQQLLQDYEEWVREQCENL